MNKKKLLLVMGIFILLLNIIIIKYSKYNLDNDIVFAVDVTSDTAGVYQIYYSMDENFNESNSKTVTYSEINNSKTLIFEVPSNTNHIRFDFPEAQSVIKIENLQIEFQDDIFPIDNARLGDINKFNSISKSNIFDTGAMVETIPSDPHIVFSISDMKLQEHVNQKNNNKVLIMKFLYCGIINVVYLIFAFMYHRIAFFTKELFNNRKMIFRLAKNDFKTKYVGSYLGIIWAFIQPMITIAVYWFVFEIGFRTQKVGEVPYVLWLSAGLIPWFYFSEAWLGGTNSLIEYSYLVKKVVFRITILPIVKISSALIVHVFFVGFIILLFLINGYMPDIYTLQIIYYVICMISLLLGISYFTSAVIIFFRDLSQIISILLQIGMWMTPILWNSSMLNEKYHWILKLNPMYYVVQGYRNSLIDKTWFWEYFNWTLYFWCLVLLLFIIGAAVFKRLKPHFADVL